MKKRKIYDNMMEKKKARQKSVEYKCRNVLKR